MNIKVKLNENKKSKIKEALLQIREIIAENNLPNNEINNIINNIEKNTNDDNYFTEINSFNLVTLKNYIDNLTNEVSTSYKHKGTDPG